MAQRAQPVNAIGWAGLAGAGFVLALTIGTIILVATRAEGVASLGAADFAAIRFTLVQAVLSALISCVLAVPVARAFARRRFFGRSLLIAVMGAPFILPVVVAILGLIAIFGQQGFLAALFAEFGLTLPRLYGFHGVVLAHVFFNLPLAIRFLLQGWDSIPAERFRLVASLGMGPRAVFRILEWPMLRQVLPGTFLVIFLICLTSFAVALTLGGGPKATTIELAIYQAFLFDFDLGRAALLGMIQIVITALGAVLVWRIAVPAAFGAGLDRVSPRWDADHLLLRIFDGGWIVLVALFLLLPLASVIVSGLARIAYLDLSVWQAAGRSLAVALGSAFITLALAAALAGASVAFKSSRPKLAALVESTGYLSVAASPLVIGTGLFLLVFPIARPADLALPITALVNAAMALPFVLRALLPALTNLHRDFGRLAQSLDLRGLPRLWLLTLPRLRRPIGFSLGLSTALSMGDLGVIALFADPEHPTLPLQVYRLMGAYRMEDAAGAALLLLGLSFALFWVFDRGGRGHA